MQDKTKLSSKGQIIIPKHLRDAYQWRAGQEFIILDTEDGILLKASPSFPLSKLDEVAGSLVYEGPTKSLEDMNDAIRKAVADRHDRS